ncbi:VOC family protein [Arthrobacter sp. FW306-2-2C-D06B]|uniref:VOC family protein n=1 Tax=Arthrobacter sp. FW306-2-2C-D06B TaxID=2879618 RepID=UPI001F18A8DB|nr:VOC family protein [Arthrobacter sp. FW306-2-2C-D06B]UKA59257.1 VOC family protein [Arthrobacter sp. FW306-2-2C-D06B]
MLRVRPIQFTSDVAAWKHLLVALGLVCVKDDGDWVEFDAGSGRVALHRASAGSPDDGTTVFGVEVGDLAEFARRTVADGTRAELFDADHGQAVRITARDGFTFLADKASSRTTSPEADPALAVVGTWLTPDVPGAAQGLRNIGARPRHASATFADFSTKNGGILLVRESSEPAAGGLSFEYDGDLAALEARLAAAGLAPARTSSLLTIQAPRGGTLAVAGPA